MVTEAGVLGVVLDGPAAGVTGVKGRFNGVTRAAIVDVPRTFAMGGWNGFGVPPVTREEGFAGALSGALMGLLRQDVARENLMSAYKTLLLHSS